jgi:hypothetical protein
MASDAIKEIEDRLDGYYRRIKEGLEQKEPDTKELAAIMDLYKDAFEMYKLEVNSTKHEKGNMRRHRKAIKELENEIEWKKTSDVRNQLMGDHKITIPDQSEEGLINHGRGVLNESKSSLQRTMMTIAQAREVAVGTAEKLRQQTEELERINNNLAQIDATMGSASKTIRSIARRVMTDKYIWVLIFLLGCLITLYFLSKYDIIHL